MTLSGWWRRVGATLIDSLLLFIPTTIVYYLVGGVAGRYIGALFAMLVEGVYMVKLLTTSAGQTVGNRVVSTRVRDALTGATITPTQAVRRWVFVAIYGALAVTLPTSLVTIPNVIALVDCLYPLFDPRKQTLHDKFANTLVVRV